MTVGSMRTLRDDDGNIIIPVTNADAVFLEGVSITEPLSKIAVLGDDMKTIKASILSINALLAQINAKLSDHIDE